MLSNDGETCWYSAELMGGVDAAVIRLKNRFAADTACDTGVPRPPPGSVGADAMFQLTRCQSKQDVRSMPDLGKLTC